MPTLKDHVQAFFDLNGPLAQRLSFYEPRLPQVQMAAAIADMLEQENGRLIVEAGTGTGKSFAYLAVALLVNAKVLISTATKTLQDQLFQKDLPLALDIVKQMTGKRKHVILMKGRSNYLCLLKAKDFRPTGDLLNANSNQLLDRISEFIINTQTGDRAEILDFPDDSIYWQELSTTSETCLGQECPLYFDCFITKMRKEAQNADVIIVNHSLLCADRNLRNSVQVNEQAFAQIIPDADLWIIDEAHAIFDVATRHFGVSLSIGRMQILVRDLHKATLFKKISDPFSFRKVCEELPSLLNQLFLKFSALSQTDEALKLKDEIFDKLNFVEVNLLSLEEKDSKEKAVISSLIRRLQNIRSELDFMLGNTAKDSGYVTYVEKDNRGLTLTASPVDASQILSRALWAGSPYTVLTSASLAVNGKLDSFIGFSGFASSIDEKKLKQLILPTPFDFENQSAFYVPSRIVNPAENRFQQDMENEIRFLISLSKGGAFLLFTSYRALSATYDNLKEEIESMGLQVFRQGDAPKLSLLKDFCNADEEFGGVLFATHSFWEGVDVQGKALRMVIIDRLPFRSPEDPILKARTQQMQSEGLSAFSLLSLPEAALALKQGVGRLLRTRNDAGVVAVLDNRIYEKHYGRTLLGSLPPMRRFRDQDLLKDFWNQKILSYFC